jgi:hypothetical protein
MAQLEKIITDPLDDAEIRHYLPDVKILKYSELTNYTDIAQILPQQIDYCIILYLDSHNTGHWVALLRYGKTIEFFDSYGGKPDSQLKWVNCSERARLGVAIPFITRIFNKAVADGYNVIYNPKQYQKTNKSIVTCGRHCVLRILKLIRERYTLRDYYRYLTKLKKEYRMPYDEIVSSIITIT